MTKHKLVKAKAKASKAVKPVTVKQGELASIPQGTPKATVAPTFMYPNRNKAEIDHVRVNLKGKDTNVIALTKVNIDINALNIDDSIKALFVGLVTHNVTKFMFGYKNAYDMAFGIMPKGFNSYKAVVTHHKTDGVKSIIINANKHFGMGEIEKALALVKVNFENHKTYYKGFVSKENIDKVIKACQSLCECKVAVAG